MKKVSTVQIGLRVIIETGEIIIVTSEKKEKAKIT